ncbi:MAG: restriction endonuclease subunit S [Streptomyces sp.]|uniref:restriction endonuclease subunit S n=1 Tax=Streptomyces sp. TaxID=1931 RepID=UPI003D6B6040
MNYSKPALRILDSRQISRKRLLAGDLLLEASGGGPGTPVGRVALHDGGIAGQEYTCSNFFRVLRPNRKFVNPDFLKNVLVWVYGSPAIWRYQQQTTGLVNLKLKDYLDHPLSVPPLGEQERVVDVLRGFAEAERAIEASIAKLRSVRQGAQLEFMRRVTAGAVEVNWTPVRDIAEIRMGKQLSPDSRAAGGQYPYLRVANVFAGWIDYSDVNTMGFTSGELAVYGLVPGDILLNEGQSLELVGRSAIYRGGVGEYCFQNTLVRFRSGERAIPEFAQLVFEYWLQSGVFAAISKKTTSIAHLGGDRFSALSFPLVSLDEQREFVASLTRCDASIGAEAGELTKLRKLKQGLMNDLLSGRVAV